MADCGRRAWLTLGALSVPLEDEASGYFCPSLDLGYPNVRENTNPRPDQDGMIDLTSLMGGRAVSATVTALAGAGATIDEVAASFAPFMVPSARPVLHYVLDRPGAAERTLTLRAAGYSWPVVGAYQRDILLQWVAADPVVRDPDTQTATAWAGSSPTNPGRLYNLTFNRIYPVGGGGPISATISSPGDIAIRPKLRFYGPITGPIALFVSTDPASSVTTTWEVQFLATYRIDAGRYVDVDTMARTAYLDDGTSALSALDWGAMSHGWPTLPVLPATTTMSLTSAGGNTTGVTQVQATWNDGYLT
jgi:hypothetical protein